MNMIDRLLASITEEHFKAFEECLPETGRGRDLGIVEDDEFRRLLILEHHTAAERAEEDHRVARMRRPSPQALLKQRAAENLHELVVAMINVKMDETFGDDIPHEEWSSMSFCYEVSEGWRLWVYLNDDVPVEAIERVVDAKRPPPRDKRKLH